MKYPVENKEIKNVEDLLNRIEEEEANYQKEKAEIEAEGKQMVEASLYMQYHQISVNIIQSMTKHLPGNYAKMLNPYLGHSHQDKPTRNDGNRKFYSFGKDAVLNAIEKGQIKEVLGQIAIMRKVNGIDDKISRSAAYELNGEKKEHKYTDKELTSEEAIKAGNGRIHERVTHLNKGNAIDAANALDRGEIDFDEQHHNRVYSQTQKNIAETAKDKRSGRRTRIYNNEAINGRTRNNLNAVREHVLDDIPDIHFENTTFSGIANDFTSFQVRLNNVKENKSLFEACGLTMLKQLEEVRKTRTFWQKFFHPFKNSDEKSNIESLKMDLLRGGVSKEKMDEVATSTTDYLEEYKMAHIEGYAKEEPDRKSVVVEEASEAEEEKEEISIDEKTNEKEVIKEAEEEEEKELD